jgi:hypothetical protein
MTPAPTDTSRSEMADRIFEHFRGERLAEARDLAGQFLALGYEDFRVRRVLATVDAKGGRPRGAVENLTIALDLRPDDFFAWVQLSQIYMDAFEPEDGAEFSRGWHDLAPSLFARKMHF